jgi:hypothetical protein
MRKELSLPHRRNQGLPVCLSPQGVLPPFMYSHRIVGAAR